MAAASTPAFFQEQIDFFRKKINLPSERWDDIWKRAHDRAFMVAGANKADLVADLRTAVAKAVEGRGTLEDFRRDFRAIVARRGWTGWTGEGSEAGEAWRTRVFYETNLRTSYAAGRYKQLMDPELLKLRPYWRYVHNDIVARPRPQHLAWGAGRLTLRYDHPAWQIIYPPNGWGCRCYVVAVEAPKDGDMISLPDGWDLIIPRTGEPAGVDKGWGYAPGASTGEPLRQMVQDKLITYPPAITKALSREVNKYINATDSAPAFVEAVLADPTRTEPLWLGFVEDAAAFQAVSTHDLTGYLVLVPADAPRHVVKSHEFDGAGQRVAVGADYESLMDGLRFGSKRPGHPGPEGQSRMVVTWESGAEMLRAVWEVRPGHKNRALALISFVVKT